MVPILYGAGSGAARATTTRRDDAARALKSILDVIEIQIMEKSECM